MNNNLTQSTEDYLKAIYALSLDGMPASTNALAASLNVAPASITGMFKRLAETSPPLVNYRKHHGASLTTEGERAALKIIRQHRLLETYLQQSLGFPWDEVHEEACRLEHVISEAFEERIDTLLGHPKYDPHGEPIPTVGLLMPQEKVFPLAIIRPQQRATIKRVNADDADLLRYLKEKNLTPGSKLEVRAYSPFDGNLTIFIKDNDSELVVGPAVARHIYVEA